MANPVPAPVPIDQRFALLIQQFGLTKNSFAMSLGKTASVVQHLIDGRNKPGFDLLCKVFEIYPNVSRDWLLLGRGPMLVSGEPAPKPAQAPAAVAAVSLPEAPLEPIDTAEFEAPVPRRPSPTGTRLQPEEIIATLALAAAATQPARTTAPVVEKTPEADSVPSAAPAQSAQPAVPEHKVATPHLPEAASPPAEPLVVPPAPTPAATPADTYIAAALHAQHLQHQLALAELRNQHLQEQQNMLREMLAMARQSMV